MIEPNPARVSPSGTQKFTAEALFDDGRAIDLTAVRWSASRNLGTISADGILTAAAVPGEGLVSASAVVEGRTIVGRAFVRVADNGQSGAKRLVLTPRHVRLAPGGGASFSARAIDGSIVTPEWRVIPENLGTMDASGHFTAGPTRGEGRVVALSRRDSGVALGQARIVVREGAPDMPADVTARLTPHRLVLQPGETGSLRMARTLPAGSSTEWSVSPATLGTVTPDGQVTAGVSVGDGIVSVRVTLPDGRTTTAAAALMVTERAAAVPLRITPHNPKLAQNQTQAFTVTRSGQRPLPPGSHVEWRVVPSDLGDITPSGVFTPLARTGSGTIIAEVRSARGALLGTGSTPVKVLIRDGAVPALDFAIVPERLDLVAGGGQVVRIERLGDQVSGAKVHWGVTPSDLLLISPRAGGAAQVRALRAGSGTLTATVSVGDLIRLQKSIPVTVR